MPGNSGDSSAVSSTTGAGGISSAAAAASVIPKTPPTAEQWSIANSAGEKFCKLYYETRNGTRSNIESFHSVGVQLIWVVNCITGGKEGIVEFLKGIHHGTSKTTSLSVQLMNRDILGGKTSILVTVNGTVWICYSPRPGSSPPV